MKYYSQQTMKYVNMKRVYQFISGGQGSSRSQLAKLADLSKTTVCALVDELIAQGFLIDEGEIECKKQGRHPKRLSINPAQNMFAVISWQRDHLIASLVDAGYSVIYTQEILLPAGEDPVARIQGALEQVLLPFMGEQARLLGVCIIVPGMVDEKDGSIVSTVLPLPSGAPILDRLRRAIPHVPLAVFNDTACLAYAEHVFSPVSEPCYAFVNLGEGVGASLFTDGKMARGANGMCTQFGHFSIDRQGRFCSCGGRGCLELYIGETALLSRLQAEHVDIGPINGRYIGFRELRERARQNPRARCFVSLLAGDLAYALGNLITMVNPSLIIIGGSGKALGDPFLDEVKKQLPNTGFGEFVAKVQVRFATLDDGAELRGAAKYFFDTHYDFGLDMTNTTFLA